MLRIVEGCTDGEPDEQGYKAPWKERKLRYLAHLQEAPDEVLLVSGSDKLHNSRAIVHDLTEVGPEVFKRFSTGRDGTLWYYGELAKIFTRRGARMAPALARAVQAMDG